MSTTTTTPTNQDHHTDQPRVWLVGGNRQPDPNPHELPTVRDDLMHVWQPGDDGQMHMAAADHDHHASWPELRARYDLVEMSAGRNRQGGDVR
jgi:hypothetical protein